MKSLKLSILFACALVVLASCGGNSDRSKIPPPEGAFIGSFSNGGKLMDLLLEDGAFWSAYASPSGDLVGFGKGRFDADDGNFTLSFTNFELPGDKPQPASGSGTYTSSSIMGNVMQGGKTLTFKADAIPTKNYIFKTPSSLASVVGEWKGHLFGGEAATVDVDPNGTFSVKNAEGCTSWGKLRTNSVNVFGIDLRYGGPPCAYPNENATGVGLTMLGDDGKHQLVVAVVNGSNAAGTLFYATR